MQVICITYNQDLIDTKVATNIAAVDATIVAAPSPPSPLPSTSPPFVDLKFLSHAINSSRCALIQSRLVFTVARTPSKSDCWISS